MARQAFPVDPTVLRRVRAYRRALLAAGITVSEMILFGSRAMGSHRRESDIDLAVVSPAFGKDYHAELGRLLRLREEVSLLIEPHPFHPDDLKDRWDSFAAEIRKHGILIR